MQLERFSLLCYYYYIIKYITMSSSFQICPQCKSHPKIQLIKLNIFINCNCGYYNCTSIEEFIHCSSSCKHYNNVHNSIFNNIINELNKGYQHLNTYFQSLKAEHINQLLTIINDIESSYEESYNRNTNVLSFIKILIDNYDQSNEMRNAILSSHITIKECDNRNSIKDVIKYYREYTFIENKMEIEQYYKEIEYIVEENKKKAITVKEVQYEKISCIKTIEDNCDYVHSLILLNDNRIASCSRDKTIRIYNPCNEYHCDKVLHRHSDWIYSICQLEDGTIVSCSKDKSMWIGDCQISNAHSDKINKVVSLSNNRIASCSWDHTIKIWNSEPPFDYIPLTILNEHTQGVLSILYIKEKAIIPSSLPIQQTKSLSVPLIEKKKKVVPLEVDRNQQTIDNTHFKQFLFFSNFSGHFKLR